MPRRRVLLLPNTNTLSHVTRAFAVAEWFESEGYETHIGVAGECLAWASQFHARCHQIHELWEPSGIAFPCLQWFSDREHIERCVQSHERLIQETRPQLVCGIFNFVSAASHGSIPLLSINGACMLPIFSGVLGFDEKDSIERSEQRQILRHFWCYAARAFYPALRKRDLPLIQNATELLVGDTTLIYEIAEICGIDELPEHYQMVGPINWNGWERLGEDCSWEKTDQVRTLHLNFGTLPCHEMRARVIQECLRSGARLLITSGPRGTREDSDFVCCRPFFRPSSAARLADAVICTGGVGVCYANLVQALPSLVIPTQPEQATNGHNLERAGCGRMLWNSEVFLGDSNAYTSKRDYGLLDNLLPQLFAPRVCMRLRTIQQRLTDCDTRGHVVAAARALI